MLAVVNAADTLDNECCRLTGRYEDAIKLISGGGTVDATFFNNGTSSTDIQVCFVAETPVLLGDNTSKSIEDIKIGDEVYARPHDNPTGELVKCKVVRTFKNLKDTWSLTVENVETKERLTVRGTAEHPFYVPNKGWTPLGELREGDKLINASGETMIVVSKTHHPELVEVYNFEVEDAHTYFVGESKEQSVLVHNECPYCGKPGALPHGLLRSCPKGLKDMGENAPLTMASAVDNIRTHEPDVAMDMTIGFAQGLPVAGQIISMDTLLDDEKGVVDKTWAAADLTASFLVLLSIANDVREIGEGIRTAEKSAMKKTGKAVEAVETSAQYSGGRAVRNYAAGIPHAPGVFKSTQTFSNDGNVKILKLNLSKANRAKKDGYHAHHIVPGLLERGQEARDILDTYHIDINSADNGVFISSTGHYGQRLHSKEGIDAVTRQLKDGIVDGNFAETRSRLIKILGDIGSQIQNGTFLNLIN